MPRAVPGTVSEGGRARRSTRSGARSPPTRPCSTFLDADHHRSVYTLVAPPDCWPIAPRGRGSEPWSSSTCAYDGVHRRVGGQTSVPLVRSSRRTWRWRGPSRSTSPAGCGTELELPVFLYGEVGGLRPAFFRREGLDELARRASEWASSPDAGPHRLDPRSGAVLVCARRPLVVLQRRARERRPARGGEIAAVVRESGGGMPGVQAIGLYLPDRGACEVSMNVLDLERSPLHEVVEQVAGRGDSPGGGDPGGELVGLSVPQHRARRRAGGGDLSAGRGRTRVRGACAVALTWGPCPGPSSSRG